MEVVETMPGVQVTIVESCREMLEDQEVSREDVGFVGIDGTYGSAVSTTSPHYSPRQVASKLLKECNSISKKMQATFGASPVRGEPIFH